MGRDKKLSYVFVSAKLPNFTKTSKKKKKKKGAPGSEVGPAIEPEIWFFGMDRVVK